MRDEFSGAIKQQIATRAAYRCSNPNCRAQTAGPQIMDDKVLNLGVAAHISAAAPGGPRYDSSLSGEQRSDSKNAVWLCQNCAKLVDNDAQYFTSDMLVAWKSLAEVVARSEIGKTRVPRAVEVRDQEGEFHVLKRRAELAEQVLGRLSQSEGYH
jgi:hypothetical protein